MSSVTRSPVRTLADDMREHFAESRRLMSMLPPNASEVIGLQQKGRWSKPDQWRVAELVSNWTQDQRRLLEENIRTLSSGLATDVRWGVPYEPEPRASPARAKRRAEALRVLSAAAAALHDLEGVELRASDLTPELVKLRSSVAAAAVAAVQRHS